MIKIAEMKMDISEEAKKNIKEIGISNIKNETNIQKLKSEVCELMLKNFLDFSKKGENYFPNVQEHIDIFLLHEYYPEFKKNFDENKLTEIEKEILVKLLVELKEILMLDKKNNAEIKFKYRYFSAIYMAITGCKKGDNFFYPLLSNSTPFSKVKF